MVNYKSFMCPLLSVTLLTGIYQALSTKVNGRKLWWPTHSVVNGASSTSGDWRNLATHRKHSNFYRCTIESTIITAWYGNCTTRNLRALQRVVRSAQRITGGNYLPSKTPTAPDVTGRPKRSSRTTTTRATACSARCHPEGEVSTGASKLGQTRLKNSIYLKAIRLLNSHHKVASTRLRNPAP
jgi:hypothetical protein